MSLLLVEISFKLWPHVFSMKKWRLSERFISNGVGALGEHFFKPA